MGARNMLLQKKKLERYKWYWLARELTWSFQSLREGLDKHYTKNLCVTLRPAKPSQGSILLSYFNTFGSDHVPITKFFSQPHVPLPKIHNEWESLQMARTFLEMGYTVDVISWTNDRFIPQKHYEVFIDVRHNMERLAPLLPKDCVKIVHIDLCHMLYNNWAEAQRLLELQARRGVTLRPRRFEQPNLAIEHADCATILGNEFTMNTFRYAKKNLHCLPVTNAVLYSSPEEKNFEACRKHYLWLGSGGFVRKGLDLVLDAFSEMPEYNLTVCGPIQQERDFERTYYKELYETPNIRTVGWVDLTSPEFVEITNNCLGLIYPSCSEGQVGSAITCLHAGLLPIISYESGLDVHGFGMILKEGSIAEIRRAVCSVSSLPAEELKRLACKGWEFARANHTREKFSDEYRKVVERIIATHGSGKASTSVTEYGLPVEEDRPAVEVRALSRQSYRS